MHFSPCFYLVVVSVYFFLHRVIAVLVAGVQDFGNFLYAFVSADTGVIYDYFNVEIDVDLF
jgi:hypothetical protein